MSSPTTLGPRIETSARIETPQGKLANSAKKEAAGSDDKLYEIGKSFRALDHKETKITAVTPGRFEYVKQNKYIEIEEPQTAVEITVTPKPTTRQKLEYKDHLEQPIEKPKSSWMKFIGIVALVSGIALALIGWHIANPLIMTVGAGTAVFGAGALLASFRKPGVQPDGAIKV